MTSAIRFHFSACACNLRLPAAVSRQYFALRWFSDSPIRWRSSSDAPGGLLS